MDIKPIHTDADHRAALAQLEGLWDSAPGTRDFERLEVLATLVDAYERQRTPILPPNPIEAIKFRLEQQGQTRKVLEPILGTRARVSEVLNGRRKLTLPMIRALHRELNIPLDVLVAEPGGVVQRKRRRTRRATRSSRARARAAVAA